MYNAAAKCDVITFDVIMEIKFHNVNQNKIDTFLISMDSS